MQNQDLGARDSGLAAGMMDFGFNRFITLGVIKILYVLGLVAIVLGWLIAFVGAFAQGAGAVLFVMIVGSVVAVLYAIFLRVWLELIVVIFRIGENTSKLVQLGGGQAAGGPTSPPSGP